ncbi:MAG: hypothetical protein R2880_01880 [Deinococcales bacterium]
MQTPSEELVTGDQTSDLLWQEALMQGYVERAKLLYVEHVALEARDEAILAYLRELSNLQSYLRAKKWRQALELLESLEASLPLDMDVKRELAELAQSSSFLDRNQPEEALEILEKLKSPLLLAEILTQKGTAQILLAENDAAEASFDEALDYDPKHYRALTNRANLWLEQSQIPQAIQGYEAALNVKDNFANALHNLAIAYRKQGQINKSVQLLRKAQRAMRQQDSEEAKGRLVQNGHKRLGLKPQYFVYSLLAILLLLWLRSRGII